MRCCLPPPGWPVFPFHGRQAELIDRQAASLAEQSRPLAFRRLGGPARGRFGDREQGRRPGALATYGADQMGRSRHRLNPGEARDPSAYFRASRALVEKVGNRTGGGAGRSGLRQTAREIACRASGDRRPGQGPAVRPAAFLAGGLERVELGHGLAAWLSARPVTSRATSPRPSPTGLIIDREVARFDLGEFLFERLARGRCRHWPRHGSIWGPA